MKTRWSSFKMFLIGIMTFSIINFYSSYEKLAVNGRGIVAINSWRAIKNRSEIRKNWESSLSITSGVGVLLLRVFITYTVSSGSAIFVSRTRLLVEKLNETNGEEGFIREKGHQYGVFQLAAPSLPSNSHFRCWSIDQAWIEYIQNLSSSYKSFS